MQLAKQNFDIPLVVRPEDLASPDLDELSGMTYLSYFMKVDSPGYNATMNMVRRLLKHGTVNNFTVSINCLNGMTYLPCSMKWTFPGYNATIKWCAGSWNMEQSTILPWVLFEWHDLSPLLHESGLSRIQCNNEHVLRLLKHGTVNNFTVGTVWMAWPISPSSWKWTLPATMQQWTCAQAPQTRNSQQFYREYCLNGMTYLPFFMKVDCPGYNATMNMVRRLLKHGTVNNFTVSIMFEWHDLSPLLHESGLSRIQRNNDHGAHAP